MLDFYGLITSYVAYFSTWQHENRVLETRFISLINSRDHSQNISDQIKKKKKLETKRENPGSAAVRNPGQAAHTVRDPGQATRRAVTQVWSSGAWQPRPGRAVCSDPGQVARDRSGFFFFFPGFSDMFWAGLLSKSLDSFIFFVYFRLYERLET